jgi:hypothetical protein
MLKLLSVITGGASDYTRMPFDCYLSGTEMSFP